MTAKIDVYTTTYCPYCVQAKNLLTKKGYAYQEIDVTQDDDMRVKLVEMSGGRKTVPQIFINGQSIGGFTDLQALDVSGELANLVK